MRRSLTKRNYSLLFTLVQDCDTIEKKTYRTLNFGLLWLKYCTIPPTMDFVNNYIYNHYYGTDLLWKKHTIELYRTYVVILFYVCFCFCFLSHSRIFHSFGDINNHYRWKAANFDLCSALMAIAQWGLFSVPTIVLE